NDLSHELVPEHITGLHRRDEPAVDVQVRSADSGGRDPDDRVARVQDLGIRDGLGAYVFLAVVADGLHMIGSPMLVRGISPASSTCFRRRRSSRIVCDGSRPNMRARNAPARPAGGSYCRCTASSVARPPRTGLKFTDPAVTTSESGSERQPITLFSTSLMISASHSMPRSAGPRAIQCDRPLPSSVTCSRWVKTRGRFSSWRQNAYTPETGFS